MRIIILVHLLLNILTFGSVELLQIDTSTPNEVSIEELNGLTLNQVFDSKQFGYYKIVDFTGDFPQVDSHYLPLTHKIYYKDISSIYSGTLQDFRISSTQTYVLSLSESTIITVNDTITIYWYNAISLNADLSYIEVDLTNLGIDNLTKEQMDDYYDLYLTNQELPPHERYDYLENEMNNTDIVKIIGFTMVWAIIIYLVRKVI